MTKLSKGDVYRVINRVAHGDTVYVAAIELGLSLNELEYSLNNIELRRLIIVVSEMRHDIEKR